MKFYKCKDKGLYTALDLPKGYFYAHSNPYSEKEIIFIDAKGETRYVTMLCSQTYKFMEVEEITPEEYFADTVF